MLQICLRSCFDQPKCMLKRDLYMIKYMKHYTEWTIIWKNNTAHKLQVEDVHIWNTMLMNTNIFN